MRNSAKQRIKRITSLTLVIMLFTVINVSADEAKKNAPVMVIPETTFDFQEVKEGAVLEHTFKVHNKGGSVLTIKSVKPG